MQNIYLNNSCVIKQVTEHIKDIILIKDDTDKWYLKTWRLQLWQYFGGHFPF